MSEVPRVLFVAGLSGVGKTRVSETLAADHGFFHFNIDREDGRDGIDVEGLRPEWNLFMETKHARPLASAILRRIAAERCAGGVLSFPSTALFHRELIDAAREAGIQTVLLEGRPEWCLAAFLKREETNGRGLDASHWHRNNDRAVKLYSSSGYEDVRVAAFRPNGTRRSHGAIIRSIRSGW